MHALQEENNVKSFGNSLEAPFAFEDLFFSKTDKSGIIQSGNDIFQSISQYSWEELLLKPHKIIRHADMPRAVFYLMWEALKAEKLIGAYVKNKTKAGKYYWVYAIVSPVEDGYLSVRLKPGSKHLKIIETLYENIRKEEKNKKLSPEESANRLLSELQNLGFDSYTQFMSETLWEEVNYRNSVIHNHNNPKSLQHLTKSANKLAETTKEIIDLYEENRFTALNIQVYGTRLGEEGKAIAVIANNFTEVSDDIKRELRVFSEASQKLFHSIYESQFLLTTAFMQNEMVLYFEEEVKNNGENNNKKDIDLLKKQYKYLQNKADASDKNLDTLSKQLEVFETSCNTMKDFSSGLEVICLMGKVESAGLNDSRSLSALLGELQDFQRKLSNCLSQVEQHINSIKI